MSDWTVRRILREICDPPRRRAVLASFWKEADTDARDLVASALARNLNFRLDSVRKASPERKAELMGMQLAAPALQEPLQVALVVYHTSTARALVADFLDFWKIPHVDGSIEVEDYPVPDQKAVRAAVDKLAGAHEPRDVALYLATAGLMMGAEEPRWREATWPVVDQLLPDLDREPAGRRRTRS